VDDVSIDVILRDIVKQLDDKRPPTSGSSWAYRPIASEIFEPLRRVEATSSVNPSGIGLGLSICRLFCDLMGYQLQVDSEPSRGTTFSILFTESN
jgi:light-regulated signal transduction histidine kinase (bacteriophytochrome)